MNIVNIVKHPVCQVTIGGLLTIAGALLSAKGSGEITGQALAQTVESELNTGNIVASLEGDCDVESE